MRIVAIINALAALLGFGSIDNVSEVTVELYSNPSSGYSWECESDNPSVMTVVGSYYSTTSDTMATSGGGSQKFVLRAMGAGTAHVTATVGDATITCIIRVR